METAAKKSIHPLIAAAGIAVILFCVVGIAAVMGWIPTTIGKSGASTAVSKPDTPPAAPMKSAAEKPIAAKPHSEPGHGAGTAREKSKSEPLRVATAAAEKTKCAECGVIESVREVENQGQASGLGAVGGAVVGGVLGNQVGGGRGKDIMTVVGAVGGAVAGNQIEKKVKSTKSYEITVRFEDGSTRVLSEANPPAWKPGDRVKVVNGQIQSNG